jgi:hypothetical protein
MDSQAPKSVHLTANIFRQGLIWLKLSYFSYNSQTAALLFYSDALLIQMIFKKGLRPYFAMLSLMVQCCKIKI